MPLYIWTTRCTHTPTSAKQSSRASSLAYESTILRHRPRLQLAQHKPVAHRSHQGHPRGQPRCHITTPPAPHQAADRSECAGAAALLEAASATQHPDHTTKQTAAQTCSAGCPSTRGRIPVKATPQLKLKLAAATCAAMLLCACAAQHTEKTWPTCACNGHQDRVPVSY